LTPPAPIATARLRLQPLSFDDAPFIVELLNDPAFLRYIGDKGVRDEETARQYLTNGPLASYAAHGFGLLRVGLAATGQPIGICGLLKRDALPHPDVGFAFLPAFCRNRYGYESARAVLDDARRNKGMGRVLAITSPDNDPSIRLLEKLGFAFEGLTTLTEGQPAVKLFASEP
jgi:ribosomal-protein-alanine N-acetyltransferase